MHKKKIGLGVIHNNNTIRNKKLFSHIELLKQKLEAEYEIQLVYVSLQPEIATHSFSRTIYRDFKYWQINREWLDYRLLKKRNLFLDFLVFFKNTVKKIFEKNNRHYKTSFIETVVTDKHIRAWEILLEENDYCIFFEDDAVFLDDSYDRFLLLLNYILDIDKDYLYVDLAGGCNLNDLAIENLEQKKVNDYIFYNKPVTNTACSYLINRKMMLHFHECLVINPTYRQIGIDWMMNKMLIELDKKSNKADTQCIHTNPTIIEHGSVSGVFNPWERI